MSAALHRRRRGSWLVLTGVRDGVDHDVGQVMIGQPVQHLAS
jgi:hypothetical protein